MGEVLEYEAVGAGEAIDPRKEADIEEVLNYRKAMRQAEEMFKSLPLCNRLIKKLHETLLSGVRGHDRGRGRFRTIQNYIGAHGAPIEKARFIPIAPEDVEGGMGRWEKYLHEDTPDRLVQLAIVHAEFESLHPFLDGNGRIGRMILPLFLFDQNLLHAPMFYLSEYLEANRQEYYDRLLGVSREDDWTGWCRFFLEALTRQANQNEAKVRQIIDLYQRRKDWIVKKTHSQHAIRALDFLFGSPVFTSTHFVGEAKIPAPSARRILMILAQNRLLKTLRKGSGRRPATFAFTELLNITEGRKVF